MTIPFANARAALSAAQAARRTARDNSRSAAGGNATEAAAALRRAEADCEAAYATFMLALRYAPDRLRAVAARPKEEIAMTTDYAIVLDLIKDDVRHIPDQGGQDLPYDNWLDEDGRYLGADVDGVAVSANGKLLTVGQRYVFTRRRP